MGNVITVTSQNWDKVVLNAAEPVMVDFWAAWCGPCKMIAPAVEELADEYSGRISVCKLNTDENPDIASRYQIMGIPSLLFFKAGKLVDKIVGAASKKQFKEKMDALLAA